MRRETSKSTAKDDEFWIFFKVLQKILVKMRVTLHSFWLLNFVSQTTTQDWAKEGFLICLGYRNIIFTAGVLNAGFMGGLLGCLY